MKKNLLTLFVLSALSFIPSSVMATDYAPMGDLPASPSQSSTLPIYTGSGTFTSITQQLYYASEMTAAGASAGDITALKFYFGNKTTTVREVTRNLEIFIKLVPTSFTEFEVGFTNTDKYTYKFTDPGSASTNKVFDGNYTIPATVNNGDKIERTISTSRFYWDGTSNILVTIIDKTNKKFYSLSGDDYSDSNLKSYGIVPASTASRFVHMYWMEANSDEFTNYKNSLDGKFGICSKNSTVEATERTAHSYVNIVKFTIEPHEAPTVPSTPEDLAASSIGSTSASLSWSAVDGATSYDLYNSTSIDGVYSKFASPTTNSYDWSGLTASTTYFVKVAAVNGAGSSDLSEPISFTTLAPHIHDGITFEPWSNPSAMPTSGNYYLANDVALAPYDPTTITLTGNLNLCLNGNTANLCGTKIVVPDDKTLAIYDNVGGGKITGFVASEVGVFDIYAKALIVVYNGAELDMHQGTIENTYIPDEGGQSYAIYSNGTLRLSGDVLINSNSADIYLHESRVMTLDGALTNAEKHTIYKNDGVITSGWSTYMSAADPRDYLESVNSAKSIYFNGTEAALQTLLTLSETALNSAINSNDGQIVDVNLTRPLVASQYNTFCLPFALDNTQLEEYFGAGYDLEELTSTSLEDDMLNLTFNKVTALVAGKPYLLKPADDVSSVMFFDDMTIEKDLSNTVTSYVDFKGVYGTTSLEGGNRNLLFLGAGNELFWPASDGEIKAFRAYFEVKGAAQKAAKRARIVKKEDAATGVDQITNDKLPMTNKILRNGEILILRDGKTYNVLGMECK